MGGSEDLAALALRIKLEAPELRVELLRGLKKGAAPLIPLVHDAARAQLPHGGGLNEQVASQKVSVSVRTSAKTAGVRMTTRAPDTKMTDSGFVRHPIFARKTGPHAYEPARGHGKVIWRTQPIPAAAGWWSKTLGESAPAVTPELLAVMEQISARIQAKGV